MFTVQCMLDFPKKKHFWERGKEISLSISAACDDKYVSGVSLRRANSVDFCEKVSVSGRKGDKLQEKFDVKLTFDSGRLRRYKPGSVDLKISFFSGNDTIKTQQEHIDFEYEEVKVRIRFDIPKKRISFEEITDRYPFADLRIFNETSDVCVDVQGSVDVKMRDGNGNFTMVKDLIIVNCQGGGEQSF